ncbi:MAG: DUF4070 domain-containing protein [Spirochaetes bacterium]|nr:DUF4070 domain-containing protein [Spirochaetota bacterium]
MRRHGGFPLKKKILLVYPEIPLTYWNFGYIMKMVGRKAAFPPLGLLTVASLIPHRYDVNLVDLNTTSLDDRDIINADLVFISAMIIQRESFEAVVERCRILGTTVVAGGPYPTGSHRGIIGIDHFVLGEAEITLPLFFCDYETGAPKKIYRSDARPDIRKTPVPRFDLVRHGDYTTMSLQYSRGCPFNCEFCDIIELFGRVSRTKSPGQFLAELDALYRTGYRGPLFVVDDNFIGNKREVKGLLRAMARWQEERGHPYLVTTEASLDLAGDGELMDLMVAAGFNKVFLGIETPIEESLAHTNKSQNLKRPMLESVERIQRKGMEVTAGFIVGFDTDPEDVFDRQLDFIRQSAIPMAMAGLLIALPSTRLYRRLEAEGRLLRETGGNNTHDFTMNFEPVMESRRLVDGYKRLISRIYSPREYFNRSLELMRRMPRGRVGRGSFSPDTVTLIARIFLACLPIQTFSFYGPDYLRYLAAAMRISPLLLPKAIKLGLFGHHFFRLTRELVALDDYSVSVELTRARLRKRIEGLRLHRPEALLRDIRSFLRDLLERDVVGASKSGYRRLHGGYRERIEEPMMRLLEDCRTYLDEAARSMKMRLDERSPSAEAMLRDLAVLRREAARTLRARYRRVNGAFREQFEGIIDALESSFWGMMRERESGS